MQENPRLRMRDFLVDALDSNVNIALKMIRLSRVNISAGGHRLLDLPTCLSGNRH